MRINKPSSPSRLGFLGAAAVLCLTAGGPPAAAQSAYRSSQYRMDPARRVPPPPPPRIYIGAGGVFNLRHGRGDEIVLAAADYWGAEIYKCRVRPDFDGGFGLNLKAGYFFSEWFALEARFNHHLEHDLEGGESFVWDYYNSVDVVEAMVEGKANKFDITLNGKFFITGERIRPFGVIGLGYLRMEKNWEGLSTVTTYDNFANRWRGLIRYEDSASSSGVVARIGAGADYFFTRSLGLDAEISYNAGFGGVSEVSFVAFSLGALLAF